MEEVKVRSHSEEGGFFVEARGVVRHRPNTVRRYEVPTALLLE